MKLYKLVNPRIIGTFTDTYNVKNADDAAKKFWENLTKNNQYISGNVPQFLFTMMDTSTKDLIHFKVQEKTEGKIASYKISKIDAKITDKQKENFLNKIEKNNNSVSQTGGDSDDDDKVSKEKNNKNDDSSSDDKLELSKKTRKHRRRYDDSSSSSSSSDDDDYEINQALKKIKKNMFTKPIVSFEYYPMLYTSYIDTVYIPTFTEISPYTQLWISPV